MNNFVKNSVVFSTGVVVGFCAGCVYTIKKVVENVSESEALREAIKSVITDKIAESLYGNQKVSHHYWDNTNSPIFETRSEAEKVLDTMTELITSYGFLSVEDYKYIISGPSTIRYNDYKIGWSDLKDAKVVRVRSGYSIDLPTPNRKEKW